MMVMRVNSNDGSQPSLRTYFCLSCSVSDLESSAPPKKSVSTNKVVVAVVFVLVVVGIVITALQCVRTYVSTTSTSFAAALGSEHASGSSNLRVMARSQA